MRWVPDWLHCQWYSTDCPFFVKIITATLVDIYHRLCYQYIINALAYWGQLPWPYNRFACDHGQQTHHFLIYICIRISTYAGLWGFPITAISGLSSVQVDCVLGWGLTTQIPPSLCCSYYAIILKPLQWRHNERDGVRNHQPHDCLPKLPFRRRSKKTSKLPITGFGEGNARVTGEFPTQRASNVENASIWWRHHDLSRSFLAAVVAA